MSSMSEDPFRAYEYLVAVIVCGKMLSILAPDEWESFRAWEKENVLGDGVNGSSDWPGWEKYIGPKPVPRPLKKYPVLGRVYLMRNERNGLTKIGFSIKMVHREKVLQSEEPEVRLLFSFPGTIPIEHSIHVWYREKRKRGEWFDLSNKDVSDIRAKFGRLQ